MRKLKPLLALWLIVTIIFLSGCANIQALFTENGSDFYEITAISKKADTYASVDVSGDNILFLTASGIADYELTVYNAQSNRITAQKSMSDCPLEFITSAKFVNSEQIVVYDESDENGITYDLNLNETGTTDHVYESYFESAPESPLLNDTFVYEDMYAYSYVDGNCYFLFYDDPEKVYVTEFQDEYIHSSDEGKLLTVETKYPENYNSSDTTVYVKDIQNALCINSVHIGSSSLGLFTEVTESAINEKYVCLIAHISNDQTGGSKFIPYLWKYTESPDNEAIELTSLDEAGILEDNEKLISEIRSKYGINVFVNKEPEFGYDVDLNAALLPVNGILTQLSACLDLFPDNFLKEIYQDTNGVRGLNIYIVEDIDGAGAFATDFIENYEICFGCHSFGRSVIFHEFMHLIDNRILTYYEDNNMDFYDQWLKLNPDDFEYGSETDYDPDDGHFVSLYAMTNVAEDLADTFQAMFEAYENGGDRRFNDYEYVNKKAKLICEAIRNAFPCMENANEVCWEKYAEYAN